MFGRMFSLTAMVMVVLAASLATVSTARAAPIDRTGTLQQGPPGEWGDAPEGTANAYPFLGFVPGAFPTCMNVGPATWIYHMAPIVWFGPALDTETEGNAGLCPLFAPYDADECFLDGDAGLITPRPYTIAGAPLTETPCAAPGTSLGPTCAVAVWGLNVDISISNPMQNQAFVNVLMDWDQSASWGGASPCPLGPAPEWVLVNHPVPPGFVGPLSALAPPPFRIGPRDRFEWARFTISPTPITLTAWDGSGDFQGGETEDYLLRIDTALAVTIADFAARSEDGQVIVTWRTVSEIDVTGFNLRRSQTPYGPRVLVTYLPAQVPGGTAGADYQVTDVDVQAGHVYWYWLEAIELNGAGATVGPVSATVLAPTAVRLSALDSQSEGPLPDFSPWGAVLASLVALAGVMSARRQASAE